jgi:selenide,water dikinase
MKDIKLTQYSHGAGCGCKIAPGLLSKIIGNQPAHTHFDRLLVGNDKRDDAAVVQLNDDQCIVSTTDFFMPIVDNPFDFGRIAATNAISDIYAMGGTPIMAIAILGWPIDKIPVEVAGNVIQGGRDICTKAGIPLAGGHSIDSPEPIFGLAVTGTVEKSHLKTNDGAQVDNLLYLTKSIGVGIMSTAQKKGLLIDSDFQTMVDSMTTLNDIGAKLGQLDYVMAMTDVTGFGLLGHLIELCEGSGVGAQINYSKVPIMNPDQLRIYLSEKCVPGGSIRNWKSYGHKVQMSNDSRNEILCDPQTSGGLLIAIKKEYQTQFESFMAVHNTSMNLIGKTYALESSAFLINVV